MRTLASKFGLSVLILSLFGCDTGSRIPDGGPNFGDAAARTDGEVTRRDAAIPVGTAVLTGTVWAPGNAPGAVPAGHEIPISNALVRLRSTRPDPIPDTVYCERCIPVSGLFVLSDAQGNFQLSNVPEGNFWLIVEKGQFRIEREITVADGELLAVPADFTTLPSVHDPSRGQNVPRIAMATGQYDSLEDVLGKMGIGGVDGSGAYSSPSDRIHFYENGGRNISSMGSLEGLVRDLSRMMQYHIIFIPCSEDHSNYALSDVAVLRNIRDYVAAGGKLYVTDWSGEWHDNVWPTQLQLGDSDFVDSETDDDLPDTPPEAYDAASDTWNTFLFGDADGDDYDSPDASAVDPDLHAWLNGQVGPLASGGEGTYNASSMTILHNWNTIESVNSVQIGVDEMGMPVIDTPHVFVEGSTGGSGRLPLTVTYEPAGCGRVLYSTYHTTNSSHVGLVPQERILLYLIMEIGICHEGPILI